jgi:tetratricopeptide (TPR) repeat protein
MGSTEEARLCRLQSSAERALRKGCRRCEVLPVLNRLADEAPPGSEFHVFAHRQLAELHIEDQPWQAALHLRRIVRSGAADDGIHALLGLCHALLGNYGAAVGSYRRALAMAPNNPWYHHNLGHLLDVAMDRTESALHHLRIAHRTESEEDEITASLAHCLARLGQLAEAETMARRAVDNSPGNEDHKVLLDWVERGAPAITVDNDAPLVPAAGAALRTDSRGALREEVLALLERKMPAAGFSANVLDRARALCADLFDAREVTARKPAALAAAIEYAAVDDPGGGTRANTARRYGISPASLSRRLAFIRDTVAL